MEIQVRKQAMLSGPVLVLYPMWALEFGGVAEGLLFQQLLFRSGGCSGLDGKKPTVKFSYTKLQAQLPFFSRRWIIEIIKRLSSAGAIEVIHTKRVNEFVINLAWQCKVEATPQNSAAMLVFPTLAEKVGLLEAIALQQIHLRHHDCDGGVWVIRSYQQWQADVFMFLGIATVKRLFARLKAQNLIFVKPYHGEDTTVNSYRVNYVQVAHVLGIPAPDVPPPTDPYKAKGWTNPLNPKGAASGVSEVLIPGSVNHYPVSEVHAG